MRRAVPGSRLRRAADAATGRRGCCAGHNDAPQIAAELGLSVGTVRSHLHRIYTRIGAADRTQAILLANKHGWIY